MVGAPECGDVMKLQIKVNPETGVIDDAKFKTFGCGSAIASSSLATEWLKGKTVDQALADQEHRDRQRTQPAAGEDPLLGAGRGRDQGGDYRLQEETGDDAAPISRCEIRGVWQRSPAKCAQSALIHVTPKAVAKIREAFAKQG